MKIIGAILLLVITLGSSPTWAKSWGSVVTSELTEYCKKAGGTARVFECTATDTCDIELQKRALKKMFVCADAETADCDCGPKRCLKDDKCVVDPPSF